MTDLQIVAIGIALAIAFAGYLVLCDRLGE
jgi:hypothetical protein